MNNLVYFQNYQPKVNILPSYNNNIYHPRPSLTLPETWCYKCRELFLEVSVTYDDGKEE